MTNLVKEIVVCLLNRVAMNRTHIVRLEVCRIFSHACAYKQIRFFLATQKSDGETQANLW